MGCTRPIFLALVALTPSFGADLNYERALALYNTTNYEGAIHQLSKSASDARSLALLGQAYVLNEEFHRASDTLERAATLDPDESNIQDWLGRAYGRRAEHAFPISAMILAGRARDAFEKAVRLNPGNADALGDLLEFYLQAPAMLGGGIGKARSIVPLIAKSDPAEGHYARARILQQDKDFGRAEAEYRKAIATSPDDVGRMIDLAAFLADRGRPEESDRVLHQAESADPGSARVGYAKAECWIHHKRNLGQAIQLLRRYLSATNLTPDDTPRADAQKLLEKALGE